MKPAPSSILREPYAYPINGQVIALDNFEANYCASDTHKGPKVRKLKNTTSDAIASPPMLRYFLLIVPCTGTRFVFANLRFHRGHNLVDGIDNLIPKVVASCDG
jgi:hypothetical protein